jgi:hypothetical protein
VTIYISLLAVAVAFTSLITMELECSTENEGRTVHYRPPAIIFSYTKVADFLKIR